MANDLGKYPIHTAAYYGCEFAIERLLDVGAEVDRVTENLYRQTALHVAAQQGEANVCVRLVKAGAELTRRSASGFTPLLEAIYSRRYAAIGQLLALGTPLSLRAAVCLRQAVIVQLLICDNPAIVHEEPDSADLVAEAVFFEGGTAVLRPLLEAGADPNSARVSFHSLHSAAERGDQAAAELLLAYGADPDRVVRAGAITPRQFAEDLANGGVGWALELFSRASKKPT